MRALFALLAAAPLCAVAQSPDAAIHVGSRLKVVAVDTSGRANGRGKYLKPVGSVASIDDQTLLLFLDENAARGSTAMRVPMSGIIRVEESMGRRRHVWQGMLVGGGIGWGVASLSASRGDGSVARYTTIGAVAGALSGYFIRTEVWRRVDVGRVRLQVGLK